MEVLKMARPMKYYKKWLPYARQIAERQMGLWTGRISPYDLPEGQQILDLISRASQTAKQEAVSGLAKTGVTGPALASVVRQMGEQVPLVASKAMLALREMEHPANWIATQQQLGLGAGKLKLGQLDYMLKRKALEEALSGGGTDWGDIIGGVGQLALGLAKFLPAVGIV